MTGKDQERKEAIRYIENQIRDGYIDLSSLDEVEMDIITCALKQYEQQKWIPCSERLPDDGEEYLVTVQCDGHSIVDIDQCFSYGWDDYGVDVIAWMPLPTPYQEDKQ